MKASIEDYKSIIDLLYSVKYLRSVLSNNQFSLLASERATIRECYNLAYTKLLELGWESMRINLDKGNIDFLINLYKIGERARINIE